jgi:hypothetical protein
MTNQENFSFLQCSDESLKKFDLQVKDKRELLTLINDSIYRKCAKTCKEKFEVLDLRDKVLKLIRYEINLAAASGKSSDNEGVLTTELLIGNCQDMCPEKERYSRGMYLSCCFFTNLS